MKMGRRKQVGLRALLWVVMLICLISAGSAAEKPGKKEDGKTSRREAAERFFTQTTIPVLHFEVPEEALQQLRSTQWREGNRPVVRVRFREGTQVYTNVALHLKGSAGSFQSVDQKPGFTLNMDKYADGQTFYGMDKLSLNNSRQDRTYISDKLCREIYEKAGVPVPRGTYVQVRMNNRELGLYLLTEGWDKSFLKRHFKNTKGNLYDGGFARDLTPTKEVNSGEDPENKSDLQALIAAAREPDLGRRRALLEKQLDIGRFITLMALDSLLWNWDGYSLNKNNYRVYHDMDQDRMVFFPHGLDQMFWRPEGPLVPAMKGMVAKAAMEIPDVRARYLQRAGELLAGDLRLEVLTNRVHELAARVQPALASLNNRSHSGSYGSELAVLLSRIEQRIESSNQQMEGIKRLVRFNGDEVVKLTHWEARPEGGPHLRGAKAASQTLELYGKRPGRVYATTVWLEEGRYRLEGRVKVEGVVAVADPDQMATVERREVGGLIRNFVNVMSNTGGAGFRVWSERKLTEGQTWDWFPFRESNNVRKRGLLPAVEATKRLAGTADWRPVTYEFELRQPYADLHIIFDLLASDGKAVLDANSVTLRKVR